MPLSMPIEYDDIKQASARRDYRWRRVTQETAMSSTPPELDDIGQVLRPGTAPAPRAAEPPLAGRFVPGTRTWAFLLLLGLYVLPGLAGHEPWKQDETYIAEIVRNMLATGDAVVPRMAGEPFMEKPPLFYWVAGALATLTSPVLPLHDGARLATGLFVLLACAALARCGRLWVDAQFGRTTVCVLLACFGLAAFSHLMLTDTALLAGIAVAMAGLPRWRTRPVASGLAVGTGVGIGFLAKGLLAPGVFGLTALLLPLCFARWRARAYARTVLVALLAALPWLTLWPAALWLRSPALFGDWFWMNNIGRFVGFAVPELGAAHDPGFWTKNLWWITFPAAPLAAVALWRDRAQLASDERLQSAVVLAAVIFGVLVAAASARGGYALPLLLPLSLLGARSALTLAPRAESAWRMGARILFGGVALALWLAWADIVLLPAPLRALAGLLPPHPGRHVDAWRVACALGATAGAAWLMFLHPRRQAALQTWVTGMALCWLLVTTLFLPWIDDVKAYRHVFRALQPALAAGCVASYGVGESERALLHYYDGIVTERLEQRPASACTQILLENPDGRLPRCSDAATWRPVWDGARPADRDEHFWLFRRASGAAACTDR
jgi:4-amino-4-deoxy-L-arabinose transferase-like glycosyltransferase